MDIKQTSETEFEIGRKEKLSFFIANFGNIPIMTLINAYLLIFYTDVVYLDPGIIALIFLVTRVIDGVNDPLMGYVIDHLPKTKYGRFRLYLMIGSVICAINYVALWLGPAFAPEGKYLIVFISYTLFGITFDVMDIPLNSMIPVMSKTGKTRNSLSTIKSLGYLLGAIFFTILALSMVSIVPSSSLLIGYTILIIFTSVFEVVASIIGTSGIRERIEPLKKENYNVKDFLRTLSAKPVIVHFISALILSIAAGTTTAAQLYFFTYIVKNVEVLFILGIFTFSGIFVGFIVGRPILNKYGKKYTFVIGTLFSNIVILFILLIDPSNFLVLFFILMISSIGGGIIQVVGYGLQADNTDYIEWKHGNRTEGAIASLVSFVNKAGLGIGAALTAFLLAITAYVPITPPPSAILGIFLATYIIPAFLGLIGGFIILFLYPLTKEKNIEIALLLKERREKQTN